MKTQDNYYLRSKSNKINTCNHDENHWCQNCISNGQKIDLRDIGLGQGYLITNKDHSKYYERQTLSDKTIQNIR